MMIDEGQFDLQFVGDDSVYRYWDATACVEFGLRMAEQALEMDLKQEAIFLQKFDLAYKEVSHHIDINNNALALMIRLCLQNGGALSKTKQKMFLGKGIPLSEIEFVESRCLMVVNGSGEVGEDVDEGLAQSLPAPRH